MNGLSTEEDASYLTGIRATGKFYLVYGESKRGICMKKIVMNNSVVSNFRTHGQPLSVLGILQARPGMGYYVSRRSFPNLVNWFPGLLALQIDSLTQ